MAEDPSGALSAEDRRMAGDELVRRMFHREPRPVGANAPSGFAFIDRLAREEVFGGLWQRDELDLKTRGLCTIAVLAALGRSQSSLEDHIRGARNNGASKDEIAEVIVQTAVYAGLPVLAVAITAATTVFAEETR